MEPSLVCVFSYGLACSAPSSAKTDVAAETDVASVGVVTELEPAPEPGSAVVVLARVQAFYDATRDLSASFRQVHKHPVYGTKDVSTGKLKLKKPGMMHWDYADKADHDVYADGDKLWIIERDTRQVVARDVAGSDFAAAVGFLFGGRKLVEEFRVRHAKPSVAKMYGAEGHDVIDLKPKKKNPHYKYVTLVVDEKTGRVDAFVVRNGDDSTNYFTLSDVATNKGLKTRDFKFRVPKGYVLIEE